MTGLRLRAAAVGAGALLGFGVLTGSAASLSLSSQKLTPYRTCTLTATPTTTSTVADAAIASANANGNFGTNVALAVSSGVSGTQNRRTYLLFDLTKCSPAIPSSAIVRLATLQLYITAVPTVCQILDLFPVTGAWAETAITWNNQPFGAAVNNPPAASRSGTFSLGSPAGCQNQATGTYTVGGTVTADVARFVSGSATNFGWMIRDEVESAATTRMTTFASKEQTALDNEPQLAVTYVTVP